MYNQRNFLAVVLILSGAIYAGGCAPATPRIGARYYHGCALYSKTGGSNFYMLRVWPPELEKGVFEVKLPSGKVLPLEDIVLDDIRADPHFKYVADKYLDSYAMSITYNGDTIEAIEFIGIVDNIRLRGDEPIAVLTYLPKNMEIEFPMKKDEVERVFGKRGQKAKK